jgi:hypothetical protein
MRAGLSGCGQDRGKSQDAFIIRPDTAGDAANSSRQGPDQGLGCLRGSGANPEKNILDQMFFDFTCRKTIDLALGQGNLPQ